MYVYPKPWIRPSQPSRIRASATTPLPKSRIEKKFEEITSKAPGFPHLFFTHHVVLLHNSGLAAETETTGRPIARVKKAKHHLRTLTSKERTPRSQRPLRVNIWKRIGQFRGGRQ